MGREHRARVEGVDVLRGLFALSIVVYHYVRYSGLAVPPALDVISLMGVDGFFMISGFALFHVYGSSRFQTVGDLASFLWRRFVRIAPLLYLVLLAAVSKDTFFIFMGLVLLLALLRLVGVSAVWVASMQMGCVAVGLVFAAWKGVQVGPTVSLLYGFIDPSMSLPGGSWSLGLEFVFYILFPLLVVFLRGNVGLSFAVLIGSLCVAALAQATFDTQLKGITERSLLVANWKHYVAMSNHFYFFICGIILCQLWQHVPRRGWRSSYVVLAFIVALWLWLAQLTSADQGLGRAAFSLLTVLFVIRFAAAPAMPRLLWAPLLALGDISYTIYLVQFPVWEVDLTAVTGGAPWAEISLKMALLIGVSFAIYHGFERQARALRQLDRAPWLRLRRRREARAQPSGTA